MSKKLRWDNILPVFSFVVDVDVDGSSDCTIFDKELWRSYSKVLPPAVTHQTQEAMFVLARYLSNDTNCLLKVMSCRLCHCVQKPQRHSELVEHIRKLNIFTDTSGLSSGSELNFSI